MRSTPEDLLTGWLRRRGAGRHGDLIGDDAAFLPGGRQAVTVDQQVAGVHFPIDLPADAVGRRLVAVNMSDVAAIGGVPSHGVLALAAPTDYPIRRLLAAVQDALAEHGAALAGGDLARSETLSAALTLLADRPPRRRWVRRDAGRPGDRLWVFGTLGESALGGRILAAGAGMVGRSVRLPSQLDIGRAPQRTGARCAVLRHVEPRAQLEIGRWLGSRRRAAAIDVSDGLLLDLERLCKASGCGATLDAAAVPTPVQFEEMARCLGLRASDLVLAGGEDYVLLAALPRGVLPPPEFEGAEIGTLGARKGLRLIGATKPALPGWDHFAGGPVGS